MIEVLHNYGGQPTGGRRIEVGTYADTDPALFGLADYLVANGHAVRLETPIAETSAADESKAKGKRR